MNKMFPYGLLREPIIGLKRADIIISTNAKDKEAGGLTLKWSYNNYLLVADIPENKTEGFEFLGKYSNILSLCAIGSPRNFQKTLENLKINFDNEYILDIILGVGIFVVVIFLILMIESFNFLIFKNMEK